MPLKVLAFTMVYAPASVNTTREPTRSGLIEAILAEHVARQARHAREHVLVRSRIAVAENVGTELVLEHLRHVVHRCVQDCDLLAVAGEQVEHRRYHVAAVAYEGRARLYDDLRAVPTSNETRGLLKRSDVCIVVKQVAAPQVDPFDS